MKGKTALITGSSAGLGYAMAQSLARAGCNVVLNGLERPDVMNARCAGLAREHGVSAVYIAADLASPPAIERLIQQATAQSGSIDILINNAVVRHYARVDEFQVEHWNQALAVNLSAAFHAIRLVIPAMRTRGWGRIFNMTSVYSSRGVMNRVDYATTKAGLLGMTRVVALENLDHGITCNALCPGSVMTPDVDQRIRKLMADEALDRTGAERQFLAGKQPTGRFVNAEHIAALMVFLCSEAGNDITGAMLPMEGGWLAS
jgi:3-hydroxybutyrate dehydrogenase